MPDDDLGIWTIFEHPDDYPDRYVARLFRVTSDGPVPWGSLMASPDLELIRHFLEQLGLTVVPRSEEDDPTVVESWF